MFIRGNTVYTLWPLLSNSAEVRRLFEGGVYSRATFIYFLTRFVYSWVAFISLERARNESLFAILENPYIIYIIGMPFANLSGQTL